MLRRLTGRVLRTLNLEAEPSEEARPTPIIHPPPRPAPKPRVNFEIEPHPLSEYAFRRQQEGRIDWMTRIF